MWARQNQLQLTARTLEATSCRPVSSYQQGRDKGRGKGQLGWGGGGSEAQFPLDLRPGVFLLFCSVSCACRVLLSGSACVMEPGLGHVLSLLLSPQNTALDKEGQIFCSKHCQDSSRPAREQSSPVPSSGQEAPPPPESPKPSSPPATSGCDLAGTWRRHRD